MRNFLNKVFILCIFSLLTVIVAGQNGAKKTRQDYIDTYKDLAIREMIRSGVPASITLAQGMLESDNGNSTLAKKANNHFGIKCHSNWEGKRIYHDDDKKKECFRKYKSVYDSYVDHSDFLRKGSRYEFLFDLKLTDYKSWAKGLKKAGYATSNKYAGLLIKIIEENDLHQYDIVKKDEKNKLRKGKNRELKASTTGRKIYVNNRIKYIIVGEGDNIESLRKELKLLKFEIYKYNDLNADSVLYTGEMLYLQPKRNKASGGNTLHVLKKGENLYSVSQKYGIKLKKLYEKNHWTSGFEPETGTKVLLRKAKKGKFKMKLPTPDKEPDIESSELKFEFDGD